MTLDHWLASALFGLEQGVHARLKAEYRSHVLDAQEAGETESQAVAALGAPNRLNVQLQLEYLTTHEAVWIDKAAQQFTVPASSWVIIGGTVLLTVLQGDRWAQMWSFWMVSLAVLITAVLLPVQLMGVSGPLPTDWAALVTWTGNGLLLAAGVWLVALLPRWQVWRKVLLHG